MPERRESPRVPVGEPCTLTIGSRRLQARIENLSDLGCLVHITEGSDRSITDEDLGAEASFVLNSTTPPRQYTGEVIRRYFADGANHIGLRFWKKYRELPTAQGGR